MIQTNIQGVIKGLQDIYNEACTRWVNDDKDKMIVDIIENVSAAILLIRRMEARNNKNKNNATSFEKCDYWKNYNGEQRCIGTKEMDVCSCNGNKNECTFYKEMNV